MAANFAETIIATQLGSLVGYWKCDEASGDLADSSGGGNTLTATAFDAADYGDDGPAGKAIGAFDASAEYASCASCVLGSTIPNDWTMLCVIKTNSGSLAKKELGVGASGADSGIWFEYNASTDTIKMRVRVAGTDLVDTTRSVTLDLNVWYVVCITCSGGNTIKIYVDGVQKGTDISFTLGTASSFDWTGIAGCNVNGTISPTAASSFQHVAMWTAALSSSEITALQNALPVQKIKPAGGGDFSSLTAWATIVDSTGGTRNAECYVGDVGALTLGSTWTPVSSTIYAASGNIHNGTDAGTSGIAYSSGAIAMTGMLGTVALTIKDLRLQNAVTLNQNSTATGFALTIERCLFKIAGSMTSVVSCTAAPSSGAISVTMTIRNNAFYVTTGTITNIILSDAIADALETATIADAINNNTITITGGTVGYGIRRKATAAATGSATCSGAPKNNIVFGTTSTGNLDRTLNGSGGTEVVGNSGGYNATTDATQDAFGATGSLGSQTAADWLTNVTTNIMLAAASPGRDAGTTVAGFSDDILATTTRPLGGAWDIGAWETDVPASGATNQKLALLGVGC